MSTTAIWKKHENYLKHIFYRENTFWTNGHFVSSVGNVSQGTIRKYIENQGKLRYPAFFSSPKLKI